MPRACAVCAYALAAISVACGRRALPLTTSLVRNSAPAQVAAAHQARQPRGGIIARQRLAGAELGLRQRRLEALRTVILNSHHKEVELGAPRVESALVASRAKLGVSFAHADDSGAADDVAAASRPHQGLSALAAFWALGVMLAALGGLVLAGVWRTASWGSVCFRHAGDAAKDSGVLSPHALATSRRMLVQAPGAMVLAATWTGRPAEATPLKVEFDVDLDDDMFYSGSNTVVTVQLKPRGPRSFPTNLTIPATRERDQRFPLVVFTGGFATASTQYSDFAETLAATGCGVLRYDVPGAAAASDTELVAGLRMLLDEVSENPKVLKYVDAERPLLIGHSRGAKLASLAGVEDERVGGLCLLDPVDNTIWAPESPGFPSACAALSAASNRVLPVAIVGAGSGGSCAPESANYNKFFQSAGTPSWLVVISDAGHAEFIDDEGLGRVQRAVCGSNGADYISVQSAAVAVAKAWVDVACRPSDVVERELKPSAKATRAEVAKQMKTLGNPGAPVDAREAAIATKVVAQVTAEKLKRLGLEFESFVQV